MILQKPNILKYKIELSDFFSLTKFGPIDIIRSPLSNSNTAHGRPACVHHQQQQLANLAVPIGIRTSVSRTG
jgi:hypothetical protein